MRITRYEWDDWAQVSGLFVLIAGMVAFWLTIASWFIAFGLTGEHGDLFTLVFERVLTLSIGTMLIGCVAFGIGLLGGKIKQEFRL